MTADELWDLCERKVLIRARSGLYDHIELGSRRVTDIWVISQTFVPHCYWLTVLHYMVPARLNQAADPCGVTVETWIGQSDATTAKIEQMIAAWPSTWHEPELVIYDWIPGQGNQAERLCPERSIGLLRHLVRVEMWATMRSKYLEGQSISNQRHDGQSGKHIHQLSNRLDGYISDQLRLWLEFGKTMAAFVPSAGPLPDICV